MFSDPIQGILIVSVTLPFFINIIFAMIEANNKNEETETPWMIQFLKAFFAISTGNLHLVPMEDRDKTMCNFTQRKYCNGCLFGISEDLPQFVFQMMNTMLIGQTLTGVQIISPMLSVILLAFRAFNTLKYKNDSIESMCEFDFIIVNINIAIIFILLIGTFISVLGCYDYGDSRIGWA